MAVVNHHSDSETMSAYHSSFITLLCRFITTLREGRKWVDVIAWASARLSVWMRFPLLAQHIRKHTFACAWLGRRAYVCAAKCVQTKICMHECLCVFVVLIRGGDFFSSPRTRTRRPSCRSRWQAGGTSCTFACAGRECCGSSCSVDRTHRGRA